MSTKPDEHSHLSYQQNKDLKYTQLDDNSIIKNQNQKQKEEKESPKGETNDNKINPAAALPPTHRSDSVAPIDVIRIALNAGYKKAFKTWSPDVETRARSIFGAFLQAILSGSYLGFSTTLVVLATSVGYDRITAGLFFAMGFVILVLMGNELVTGNFALVPMVYLHAKKRVTVSMMLWNWLVIYSGNFVGSLLYLFLLWGATTNFDYAPQDDYQDFQVELCALAGKKVLFFQTTGGAAGWFGALFAGILCNWMVTLAVVLGMSSKSTIGRTVAMYIPITLFFTLGFEHCVVNMFVLPAGLVYDCGVYNFAEWWIWNQIPVTLGNILGGATLTGIIYYVIWLPKL